MKMVITLRNGVQIQADVESYEVSSNSLTGELKRVDWVKDDDPLGSDLAWVDFREVVAVHAEREPRENRRALGS